MSDVKWIKITTDIFDDEKFDAIETLSDRHTIQLAWIKLLCLAGKCNDNGFLTISSEIPYTDEMMASRFKMTVGEVQRALQFFERLGMVEVVDQVYMVSNWMKYQSVTDLERLKEQHRERQRRYRERQKEKKLQVKNDNDVSVTSQADVICSNSISNSNSYLLDSIEEDSSIYVEIVSYLNEKAGKRFSATTKSTRAHINGRLSEGYTVDDFKKVIDNKCSSWLGDKRMSDYLRPTTLFAPSHFEEYLNEKREDKKDAMEEWMNDRNRV